MSSSGQATNNPYVSFVCKLQVSFLLSPFPIVSVAVWIAVFAHFDRCLNLFQSITKYWNTGANIVYLKLNFIRCLFWHPWVALKGPLIFICCMYLYIRCMYLYIRCMYLYIRCIYLYIRCMLCFCHLNPCSYYRRRSSQCAVDVDAEFNCTVPNSE